MQQKTGSGKTVKFMNKYLTPGSKVKSGLFAMISDARGTDIKGIAAAIRRMPYGDFMQTSYWKNVAMQVKHDAHWCCQECGRHCHNLEVHHEGYRHHGYEMFKYKELLCLCPECHDCRHRTRKKTA